ncbi:MAG: translation initiation factor IF-2, partial [Pseudomonadota bacterium]|nr:translation initiation factor IF-2 [Pseudomonadota bacterium]
AFTSMRARGASVTDIVILIVAADDGIMPQTVEAIRHAKAAEVPIIVAINKCDKPEANPDRVKQELLSHDLVPEDFGGDIVCCEISAKAGTGLEHLEEMILLQADVLELHANPDRRADGVVVESRLDKGRGPIASIIVNRGTLRVGDVFVAGSIWGRVRAMMDDKGNKLTEAGPATPVEIQGLQSVCDAGDGFQVAPNDRRAREVAAFREQKKREKAMVGSKASLESLFSKIAEGEVVKLSVVVKADVQGSVEAITDALNKLATDEVKVQVIHGAVGVITENDVNLASASDALILGFNVRANAQARTASEREGIEVRYYSVIYNLMDDVKAALTGLLSPEYEEKVIGRAEIRQVMLINKFKISGCYVT